MGFRVAEGSPRDAPTQVRPNAEADPSGTTGEMSAVSSEEALPDPRSDRQSVGPSSERHHGCLPGSTSAARDRSPARDRSDRAIRDAPAAVGAVGEDLEPGRGELHRVRWAYARAETAEYANLRVDDDHRAYAPMGRRERSAESAVVTARGWRARDATRGRAPRTRSARTSPGPERGGFRGASGCRRGSAGSPVRG
jgi:hypothetical protein